MGLTTSKAVNPDITDVNNPLYTALNAHSQRWVYAGLIGEALDQIGHGFDHYICKEWLDQNADIAIGDYAYFGNRNGVVQSFTLDSGRIATITINEDMRYLPADYKTNATAFGYESNAKMTGKVTTYVMGPNVSAAGLRNGGGSGVFLFVGTLLIMKQRTNNPNSWPAEARAQQDFQNKGLAQLYTGLASSATAAHCPTVTTPTPDRLIFIERATVAALVPGDKVWLNAVRTIVHPDGVYFGGAGFYFKVTSGVVVALPAC